MNTILETQPICPYCHRLYSPKNNPNPCCKKAKCVSRFKREKGPDQRRVHLGKEDHKEIEYWPERRVKWTWRNNPHGYVCHNPKCKKIIKWLYKDGEVFRSPRIFCENHHCQRVRDILAAITVETSSYPNRKFPATIND